ncbi:MAG: hypothetical protein M5R36_22500 [Deltaproteobacteria bacterium]|nr:hypothetical protein [Deltaproteobacteria bacterium]
MALVESGGLAEILVASATGRIVASPASMIFLTGLAMEPIFFGRPARQARR